MSTNRQSRYSETLRYLYNQLPMFSKYGKGAIKTGLDNIKQLCAHVGHPEQQFRSIHIAGTNGKGSVSHMLSAILQKSGYKTGLYTSPHLVEFGERIKINGMQISPEWVIDFTEKHKSYFEKLEPSFFEVTVAMAFRYFAEQECDIVVVETGLGGRLDSTNIIHPLLSVITNIDYDHMDILGSTLPQIAEEKAGIIKTGVPFIIGERHPETEKVFFEHAIHKKCTGFYADAHWSIARTKQNLNYQELKALQMSSRNLYTIQTDLSGAYQLLNIRTVLCACDVLQNLGVRTDIPTAIHALANVKKATQLRGRWEVLQDEPTVIVDVGHNPAGLRYTLQQWQQVEGSEKHILIGFVKDKDINSALDLLPRDCTYHFVHAAIPRALAADDLRRQASEKGLKGTAYNTIADATKHLKEYLKKDHALLITGSFFVAGEAIESWEND